MSVGSGLTTKAFSGIDMRKEAKGRLNRSCRWMGCPSPLPADPLICLCSEVVSSGGRKISVIGYPNQITSLK